MTDNEKRAHDLAMHNLMDALERKAKKAIDGKKFFREADRYEIYVELYREYLSNLNRDFPEK